VIAGARLRGGTAHSARGAASLAAEAITTAHAAGCTGLLMFRIDSAYYSAKVLHAIRRGGAHFSVTVPVDRKIRAAIASISEDAWTPIAYPRAIWDEDQQRLISDAEAAEIPYTAFASRKRQAITARLIVRRVKDLNPRAAEGQDELFASWRRHAMFTDSPFEMIQAEAQHRDHAIIGQVFADCSDGPLAHLIRAFPRERRVAHLRRDLPQPDPCRRDAGRALPREGPRRDHPQPAHQRRRPPAAAAATSPSISRTAGTTRTNG
jgi:hypothetical protein